MASRTQTEKAETMINQYLNKIARRQKPTARTRQIWERSEQRYRRSRNNLWGLLAFLLISIDAYTFRNFNLFESSSEPLRQLLGYPPPAYLISIALAVYCFSAIILTLTAMANDTRPASTWKNLGYRSAFYLFYSFSGTLAGHYIPVLVVGLCLYALDQCHIWIYNCRTLQQQKQLLG
jgi:hypothetical protein